jgi:hypothetical protein
MEKRFFQMLRIQTFYGRYPSWAVLEPTRSLEDG